MPERRKLVPAYKDELAYPGCLMHYQERILGIITQREELRIDIEAGDSSPVGYFLPVTAATANDPTIVEKLTRWRNFARRSFLTQFTATPERTRKWLETTVLAGNNRLLFLLHTDRDRLVGHYGFINMDENSAEVDNLLRGESGGSPQLVQLAEVTLVSWMFSEFGLKHIRARVLSNNPFALRLHHDAGFQPVARIPLCKKEVGDEVRLVASGVHGEDSSENLYQEVLELTPEALRRPE